MPRIKSTKKVYRLSYEELRMLKQNDLASTIKKKVSLYTHIGSNV